MQQILKHLAHGTLKLMRNNNLLRDWNKISSFTGSCCFLVTLTVRCDSGVSKVCRSRYNSVVISKKGITQKSLIQRAELDSSPYFSLGNVLPCEFIQPFDSFCSSLLVENINEDTQTWIFKHIEDADSNKLSDLDKITALNRLMLVHCFELFLLKEGPLLKASSSFCDCEMAVPAICSIIDTAIKYEVDSFVIGFSQLGMMNVLSKLLNVSVEQIFLSVVESKKMLSGKDIASFYTNSNISSTISVNLIGSSNITSTIFPLTLGVTKALHDIENTKCIDNIWSILCYEANEISDKNIFTHIIQLSSELKYSNNGCIHLVISEADEDVSPKTESQCKFVKVFADFIKAPIIHVRSEEVDSVINVMRLAADFRAAYKRDVVVDLITGANQNYPTIKKLTLPGLVKQLMTADNLPLAACYLTELAQNKIIDKISYVEKRSEILKSMQFVRQCVIDEETVPEPIQPHLSVKQQALKELPTSTSIDVLNKIGSAISKKPESIELTPEALELLCEREEQFKLNKLGWGLCELLAYGTLLNDGQDVRISHSKRFKKPNFTVVGKEKEVDLLPDLMGKYYISSTPVPDYAKVGFELGYSSLTSHSLNIWVAPEDIQQIDLFKILHDYLNCAKTELKTNVTFVIPTYTFAVEKSTRAYFPTQNKLIRNLIETLTEEVDPIDVPFEIIIPSSPSNLFHILRKQAKRLAVKPLIIFIPFEHYKCINQFSKIEDLSGESSFQTFIRENNMDLKKVNHLVLCTGTVFYNLKDEAIKRNLKEAIAVGRIEQMYPFPLKEIMAFVEDLKSENIWWVQEEHYEDGWWHYVETKLRAEGMKIKPTRSRSTLSAPYPTKITDQDLSHVFEIIQSTDTPQGQKSNN